MGNTTASLTHEQLFGEGQQSRKPASASNWPRSLSQFA